VEKTTIKNESKIKVLATYRHEKKKLVERKKRSGEKTDKLQSHKEK
jgi:hypothetical protein